jgi:uracil-DNA glycosylase family 4
MILAKDSSGLMPSTDCPLCPRLVRFRETNRRAFGADWFNGAVPAFGGLDAWLLIVGLAPGLRGANRTGRPFTGDWAGDLLYATLRKFGLADGQYDERPDDGLRLIGCRITNAVRCVPPENKPTPEEVRTCRPFLEAEIASMPNLRAILALGSVSHTAIIASHRRRQAEFPFTHGGWHDLAENLVLADSYHCSRYNTNTGRLTEAMFSSVFEKLVSLQSVAKATSA